jgi:ABC-type transport system involved in cytochrome bd biosynthesis fused ATPase/permease subunit
MASNFKIIAFKTGACEKIDKGLRNPLKIIKPNKLYSFHTQYTFIEECTDEITCDDKDDIQFFVAKNLPISINAIVGNNGSGKSTLMELLFWANYNIGSYLNFFDSKKK